MLALPRRFSLANDLGKRRDARSVLLTQLCVFVVVSSSFLSTQLMVVVSLLVVLGPFETNQPCLCEDLGSL